MKILAFLFLTTWAHAFPSAGDIAVHKGQKFVDGQWRPVTVTMEIRSYYAPSELYHYVEIEKVEGRAPRKYEEQKFGESLASDSKQHRILENCETLMNAKIEVVDVPAGQFKTCSFQNSTELLQMGIVPFGLVRLKNGEWDLKLHSFIRGH